jgi:hypothetical protein
MLAEAARRGLQAREVLAALRDETGAEA